MDATVLKDFHQNVLLDGFEINFSVYWESFVSVLFWEHALVCSWSMKIESIGNKIVRISSLE